MSGSIKLKHASGNGVIIAAPSSNPAADRTLELPSDADGVIAKTDASGNLTVAGDLTVDTSTLKVDSSNNRVGIGVASPTNQFHVYDGTAANDTPEVKIESFRPAIRFKDRSSNSSSAEIVGDNSLKFRVSVPVDDNTALTQRMSLDADGLKFGTDTAAANAISDYEEGTWTASNPNGGYTFNNINGYYTKIGNMVHWNLHVTFTLVPNDNNTFEIHGLPYTSKNVTNNFGWATQVIYTASSNNATVANMRALVQLNATYVYFHTVGLGSSARVTNSIFRTGMQGETMLLGGTYMAA